MVNMITSCLMVNSGEWLVTDNGEWFLLVNEADKLMSGKPLMILNHQWMVNLPRAFNGSWWSMVSHDVMICH